MDLFPLYNSLRIAFISTAVVFVLAIAAAWYIIRLPRAVKGILDCVFTPACPAAHGRRVSAAAYTRPQASGRCAVSVGVRHKAHDELVVGDIRHNRCDFSSYVQDGKRSIRGV